ncbi:MAG: phytanoyl-CoA dioxygenase family protein [Woeseiaceae bacterium]
MNRLPTYTAPPDGRLSAEMVADFRDAGVLILEGFVSPERCAKLREHTLELIEQFDLSEIKHVFSAADDIEHGDAQLGDRYFEESGDKIRFFFENEAFDEQGELQQSKENSLNKIGHALHDLDPMFDEFSRTPELAMAADSLGYENPLLLQSMYILKPPRIGGEVRVHQDSTYLYTDPESCIGFWFALEDATTENGCMHFIPGVHKDPLKELQYRASDGKMTYKTLDDSPWPENATVAAEAKAGTLVIFDGRAPHLSGPNRSDRSRHAYTFHVIEQNSHYPAENWLQRGADMPMRGFTT